MKSLLTEIATILPDEDRIKFFAKTLLPRDRQ